MPTESRVARCTTHHHACDCREAAHANEVAQLRKHLHVARELVRGLNRYHAKRLRVAARRAQEVKPLWLARYFNRLHHERGITMNRNEQQWYADHLHRLGASATPPLAAHRGDAP